MQYVVNKTITQSIAVEADSPEAAGAAAKAGQGNPMSYNESFNVQPRPQPQGKTVSGPPQSAFARRNPILDLQERAASLQPVRNSP